jgi:hemerythrin-like domain-containing protein
MSQFALRVIKDEHVALAAMLQSLSMLVSQARRNNELPPFEILRAMLFYVDEFPERLHHPKESELLFPKVRAKVPGLSAVIDRLDQDHAKGEHAVLELEHALLGFEVLGEPRRAAFEEALDRYIRRYLEHMAIEEREILPAAQAHLSDADWDELDAAFEKNRDPLTGHEPEDGYRPLFQKIVMNAPAPVGLG